MCQRHLEPKWLSKQCMNTHTLDPIFRDHLLDPGSTTLRMGRKDKFHFSVEVRQHAWGKMQLSEAKALGVGVRNLAMIRETDLRCNNDIWMFARTVIPANSLLGNNYYLRRPLNFALGKILFTDVRLERSEFELAILRPGHLEYSKSIAMLTDPPKELWARRSVFLLRQKPLLMTEVFIPHPVLYEN